MDPRWDIFQAAQAGGAVSVPPLCSLSPSCCGWGPLAQDPLCGGCVPPAHPVRLGGAGTAGTEPAGRWPRDFSNTALLCQRPVLQWARRAPGIAVQQPDRPAAAVSTGAPCHHGEGTAPGPREALRDSALGLCALPGGGACWGEARKASPLSSLLAPLIASRWEK